MKYIFLSFFLCGILFLTSCSAYKGQTNLDSNQWELVSLTGTAPNGERGLPYVMFTSGYGFSGYTGCNTFTGSYTLESSKLSLNPGIMTKMFCAESRETDFLIALKKVNGYKIIGNSLYLFDGNTELMKFRQKN
ncbi:MAG TPA: META domain-containing protein [Ignavibacteria bacterium]|nr:META domain-containing protein [Ignavibacteria bacterium]